MNDTALKAIKRGSRMAVTGEAAMVAAEMPNKDATGVTQTPTQAPPLQHANKMGTAAVTPPVIEVQIDFIFIQ